MKIIIAIFAVLTALLALVYQAEAVDCDYQEPGCFTTLEVEPVCGANGCTYSNEGKALCGGTTKPYSGNCV